MGFDPYNCSLKIQESIRTPTPKVGVHLGVWGFIPSHSLALLRAWNVTIGFPSWSTPSQALALVTSPKLGSQHQISSNGFKIKWQWRTRRWTIKEILLQEINCPRPYKPQIKVCKQNIMSSQSKENLKEET